MDSLLWTLLCGISVVESSFLNRCCGVFVVFVVNMCCGNICCGSFVVES